MNRNCLAVAALALVASSAMADSILRGPILNPTNGHRYYAVHSTSWTACQAYARSLGGDLVTINDAAENEWVRLNMAAPLAGTKLWIGLNSAAGSHTTYSWSDTSALTYTNWAPGMPSGAANDYYVRLRNTDGTWDNNSNTYTADAIVEVGGALRVPAEFPTIAAAFAAMPAAGLGSIVLTPGTYAVDAPLVTPAGITGTISVQGAGTATILCPTGGPAFTLGNGWNFYHINFVGRGNATALSLNDGAMAQCFFCTFAAFAGSTAPTLSLGNGSQFWMDVGSFTGGGSVLHGRGGTSLATLRSVLINGGTAATTGSGVTARFMGDTLTNVGPGQMFSATNTNLLRGSIVWGNSGTLGGTVLNSQFSDIQFGPNGLGDMNVDPQFVDAAGDDFALRPGSPCIDHGTIQVVTSWQISSTYPFFDGNGMSRLMDDPSTPNASEGLPSCDIGAFEFQGASCPADFNHDGSIDFFDYLDFVDAFSRGC